jgi:hypothetical protein
MNLNKTDDRSPQTDDQPSYDHDKPTKLMTPARRAALDALERELRALLNARVTN